MSEKAKLVIIGGGAVGASGRNDQCSRPATGSDGFSSFFPPTDREFGFAVASSDGAGAPSRTHFSKRSIASFGSGFTVRLSHGHVTSVVSQSFVFCCAMIVADGSRSRST